MGDDLHKQTIYVAFNVVFTFFCKTVSDRKKEKKMLPIQFFFCSVDSNPLIPKGKRVLIVSTVWW